MMRYQARMHPTLDILCDTLGRVFLPQNGKGRKAHWTFGCLSPNGYRYVGINGKTYKVSRLICETFHGLAPEDKPTCDHINRIRDWDTPENLRWASYKTQADNKQRVDDSLARYGVRSCNDLSRYMAAYYTKNLEQCRASQHDYKAKLRVLGKRYRRCPDGSRQWLTDEEFFKKFGFWPKK